MGGCQRSVCPAARVPHSAHFQKYGAVLPTEHTPYGFLSYLEYCFWPKAAFVLLREEARKGD
jgi:hypothetical protein